MSKIFLCYRREDSEDVTGRLWFRLVQHFDKNTVFFDVDTIPIGIDFRNYIRDTIKQCDVVLAVIGNHWAKCAYQDGTRRLDDERDQVRIELETAVTLSVPIWPVLVGRALMPSELEFPDSLRDLAYQNAAEVRPGKDFDFHTDRLIQGLEKYLSIKRKALAEKQATALQSKAGEVMTNVFGIYIGFRAAC